MALFLAWQKYQKGQLAYFSMNYAKSIIRTMISYYVRSQTNQLDQTAPFRGQVIIPIGHKDIQHELISQSLESRYHFLEMQSSVMGQLNPKELQVYDDLVAGKTREEICQSLKIGHNQYTKIRQKIKELFQKCL